MLKSSFFQKMSICLNNAGERGHDSHESVFELLVHILVVKLEIDAVKAGQLLTSKYNLLVKLIHQGV